MASLGCSAATAAASNACIFEGNSITAAQANTKYVYLNVSVWAHAIDGTAGNQDSTAWHTAAYDTYIQFYASSWGYDEHYPPAAAAAPTALNEPAAAQALAASAAAALAIAAAFY